MVGTGDLSEIALGWATFAGDHIAMYGVNASVPKTLVRRLVEWVAAHHATRRASARCCGPVLETPVSPELVPPAKRRRDRAEDRGPRRPLRARTTSSSSACCAGGRGRARSSSSPSTPSPGRYDAATLRRLARRLPAALLRPAVEALRDAGRAEGRLGEPLAARRLAHAERRPPRRPGCASSRVSPAVIRAVLVAASDLAARAGRHRPLPPQRGARPRVGGGRGPPARGRGAARRGGRGLGDARGGGVVAALRQDPITRPTAIVALGRSEFGFDHLDLLEAGANAILPLPPGHDWDDRLMRLIHVPVRQATRFPVDIALEGGLRERPELHRARPQPERPRAPARVPRHPSRWARTCASPSSCPGPKGADPGDGHRGPGGVQAPLRGGADPRRRRRAGPHQALRRVRPASGLEAEGIIPSIRPPPDRDGPSRRPPRKTRSHEYPHAFTWPTSSCRRPSSGCGTSPTTTGGAGRRGRTASSPGSIPSPGGATTTPSSC